MHNFLVSEIFPNQPCGLSQYSLNIGNMQEKRQTSINDSELLLKSISDEYYT